MPQVTRRSDDSPGASPCPKCGSPRELIAGEKKPGQPSAETWMCPNGHLEVRMGEQQAED